MSTFQVFCFLFHSLPFWKIALKKAAMKVLIIKGLPDADEQDRDVSCCSLLPSADGASVPA